MALAWSNQLFVVRGVQVLKDCFRPTGDIQFISYPSFGGFIRHFGVDIVQENYFGD
jgi:hypothetical protein